MPRPLKLVLRAAGSLPLGLLAAAGCQRPRLGELAAGSGRRELHPNEFACPVPGCAAESKRMNNGTLQGLRIDAGRPPCCAGRALMATSPPCCHRYRACMLNRADRAHSGHHKGNPGALSNAGPPVHDRALSSPSLLCWLEAQVGARSLHQLVPGLQSSADLEIHRRLQAARVCGRGGAAAGGGAAGCRCSLRQAKGAGNCGGAAPLPAGSQRRRAAWRACGRAAGGAAGRGAARLAGALVALRLCQASGDHASGAFAIAMLALLPPPVMPRASQPAGKRAVGKGLQLVWSCPAC